MTSYHFFYIVKGNFILELHIDDSIFSNHCVHNSNTVNIHYLFNGYVMTYIIT